MNSPIKWEDIYVHQIFDPVMENLSFFLGSLVTIGSIGDVKNQIISMYKGLPQELGLSVDFNGHKAIQCDIEHFFKIISNSANLVNIAGKVRGNFLEVLKSEGRVIAISCYNIIEGSTFFNKINQEDIFHFLRHIRNGAAHNNKFYFKYKLKKDIIWRNKVINDSLAGQEVFNSFISAFDLVVLMSDISKLLK